MKKTQKTLVPVIVIAVIVLAAVVGARIYFMNRADLSASTVSFSEDSRFPDQEYVSQRIMLVSGESDNWFFGQSEKVRSEIDRCFKWNGDVDQDLYNNYVAPLNIPASVETDGKTTTIRYEGYATTPDGETVDYYKEESFNVAAKITG